jgi:plastocyanin
MAGDYSARYPGRVTREGRSARRGLRRLLVLAATIAGILALPSAASAEERTETFTTGPITVGGYQVKQEILGAPAPKLDGHITRMEADIVGANGKPIPIQRLMLHHIAFLNLRQRDRTCSNYQLWDGSTTSFMPERFFAAGEERQRLVFPPGYGYTSSKNNNWLLAFMVMNHRSSVDTAYIKYTVTVDDDPEIQDVHPYWLDVVNCQADPIYNVPGTGEKGATHTRSRDFVIPESGRLIAAGGHLHGGGKRITLTQPACGNRELGRSKPTWGLPDHPFYNVKPVLHEPGPINMSGFGTPTGIPVAAGQRLRLSSVYENTRPHVRVMGIMVAFIAPDPSVTDGCAPLPSDMVSVATDEPGRRGPIPYRIPLTGLDRNGEAKTIKAPPGKLKRMPRGGEVKVGDHFFSKPNVEIRKGAELDYRFSGSELHNVTLANGPRAIGSPNLDDDRVYSQRFQDKGTYRLFCALHPVRMHERVKVTGK